MRQSNVVQVAQVALVVQFPLQTQLDPLQFVHEHAPDPDGVHDPGHAHCVAPPPASVQSQIQLVWLILLEIVKLITGVEVVVVILRTAWVKEVNKFEICSFVNVVLLVFVLVELIVFIAELSLLFSLETLIVGLKPGIELEFEFELIELFGKKFDCWIWGEYIGCVVGRKYWGCGGGTFWVGLPWYIERIFGCVWFALLEEFWGTPNWDIRDCKVACKFWGWLLLLLFRTGVLETGCGYLG